MAAAALFPGSLSLKGAAALTAELIKFVYLVKIYIQELPHTSFYAEKSKKRQNC